MTDIICNEDWDFERCLEKYHNTMGKIKKSVRDFMKAKFPIEFEKDGRIFKTAGKIKTYEESLDRARLFKGEKSIDYYWITAHRFLEFNEADWTKLDISFTEDRWRKTEQGNFNAILKKFDEAKSMYTRSDICPETKERYRISMEHLIERAKYHPKQLVIYKNHFQY